MKKILSIINKNKILKFGVPALLTALFFYGIHLLSKLDTKTIIIIFATFAMLGVVFLIYMIIFVIIDTYNDD
jgi:hypothetical protein